MLLTFLNETAFGHIPLNLKDIPDKTKYRQTQSLIEKMNISTWDQEFRRQAISALCNAEKLVKEVKHELKLDPQIEVASLVSTTDTES